MALFCTCPNPLSLAMWVAGCDLRMSKQLAIMLLRSDDIDGLLTAVHSERSLTG